MKKFYILFFIVVLLFNTAYAEISITEKEEEAILQYLENNFEISEEMPSDCWAGCFILSNKILSDNEQWKVIYQTNWQENNVIKLYYCNSDKDTFKQFIKFFYEPFLIKEHLTYVLPGMSFLNYSKITEYEDISDEEYFSRIVNWIYTYYSLYIQ